MRQMEGIFCMCTSSLNTNSWTEVPFALPLTLTTARGCFSKWALIVCTTPDTILLFPEKIVWPQKRERERERWFLPISIISGKYKRNTTQDKAGDNSSRAFWRESIFQDVDINWRFTSHKWDKKSQQQFFQFLYSNKDQNLEC